MADSPAAQIAEAVTSWDGVVASPHRFGGVEFRVGRRELGHLHGSRLADLPFPLAIRNELLAEGRADPHHVLPHSGWVSVRIRDATDVRSVIELFRLNYERPWLASGRKRATAGEVEQIERGAEQGSLSTDATQRFRRS